MSKLVITGQEALPIPEQPRPQEPFHVVSYLNERRGFIELEDLPYFEIDWKRELTFLDFMGEVGVALAEEPPRNATWDQALDVHGDDFKNASIKGLLEKGLYFPPIAARRRDEVVTADWQETTLQAPGIRGRYEGVAVSGYEFSTIAHSPINLTRFGSANTKKANTNRPEDKKVDDETLRNRAGRTKVHIMESKRDALLDLDAELKIERLAVAAVNTLVDRDIDEGLPMGELDFYRRVSSIAVSKMVHAAANQLGYGTTRRQGVDRALVSAFTRFKPEYRAAALRKYTAWAGYYIDAKRGKINQSLLECEQQYLKYRHFLSTKELEESSQTKAA